MALCVKNVYYDFYGGAQEPSITLINRCERRLKEKKEYLSDVRNELELLEQQAFETYKDNVQYLLLDNKEIIKSCRDWIKMQKEGIDKRKKHPEKDRYNYYVNLLESTLGVKMSNISFIDYNFGQATFVDFTAEGKAWQLEIPHIRALTLKTYRDYGPRIFKLHLSRKNSSISYTCCGSTFEEDELKDIMAKEVSK